MSNEKQTSENQQDHAPLAGDMARASYNKNRGWDVTNEKVVKYAYIDESGGVYRTNGYCVGNHVAGDFLLHVP